MQNPLDVPLYRVGNEIYRRNCPLDMTNTANFASATAADDEREEEEGYDASECRQEMRHEEKCETEERDFDSQQKAESSPSAEDHAAQQAKQAAEGGKSMKAELVATTSLVKTKTTVLEIGESKRGKKQSTTILREEKTEEIKLVGSVRYDAREETYHDSLKVPAALIGILRGREGHKQKKIEEKFRCQIHFPKKRSARKEAEIRITSDQAAQNVQNCREEVERAIVQARKQAMPTHFVSIPILDLKMREQYAQLVGRIQADQELESECRNPAIFMPPAKLHLTLTVLKLFTDEEERHAKDVLNEIFASDRIREILSAEANDEEERRTMDSHRVRLEFPSLAHFSDRSPDRVAVLFIDIQSDRMQKMADAVDDMLAEAGLAEKRKTPNVVLHMTMMNTKYLWQKRRTFLNAKTLLEKYGKLELDPIHVEEMHLCEMTGTSGEDDLNGYKTVHTIKFSGLGDKK